MEDNIFELDKEFEREMQEAIDNSPPRVVEKIGDEANPNAEFDLFDLVDHTQSFDDPPDGFHGDEAYLEFNYSTKKYPNQVLMYVEIGGIRAEFLLENVKAVRVDDR